MAKRRLRYVDNDALALPRALEGDEKWNLFLSHVWSTGQDQMRVVKQRLLEMMPDLRIFLDVDDLEEIGNLEQYIKRSRSVLCFCSTGYFESKNCMRELRCAVETKKPLVLKYGLNHVTSLIESKQAKLVVIPHDVSSA